MNKGLDKPMSGFHSAMLEEDSELLNLIKALFFMKGGRVLIFCWGFSRVFRGRGRVEALGERD